MQFGKGARVVSCASTIGGARWWLVLSGDVDYRRLSTISARLHRDMFVVDDRAEMAVVAEQFPKDD